MSCLIFDKDLMKKPRAKEILKGLRVLLKRLQSLDFVSV